MKVNEIVAKSLLVRSKLPDTDYVVNPYVGCEFACSYCYASFMGRRVGEPVSAWGQYVYAKTNAVATFAEEIGHLGDAARHRSILLSSVTDPYQGVEKQYRLTRGILDVLAKGNYPGRVSILTKSPLVSRDVDLIGKLQRVEVGMTVTTTEDSVGRFLEVRAPLASRRLRTLRYLHDQGIETYAFVGPLLPHFRRRSDLLDRLLGALAAAGVGSIYVEHINMKRYIRERLEEALLGESPEIQDLYRSASTHEHREALEVQIREIADKYGLRLRLSEVLDHNGS